MQSQHVSGGSTAEPATRRARGRDFKQTVARVVVVLAAAWLIAFIVSNSQTVNVSFVFSHVSLSLIWVMVICALLGAMLGFVLPRLRRRR